MKTRFLYILALASALGLNSGCQLAPGTTASSIAAQIFTPANIAQAATDTITIGGPFIIANNPSYSAAAQGLADAFYALAASNPSTVTGADVQAAVGKTTFSTADQKLISGLIVGALGIYERDFAAKLPGLKPNYALFAKAVGDGIEGALGKPPATS